MVLLVAVIIMLAMIVGAVLYVGFYYGPKIKNAVDKFDELNNIDLNSAAEAANKFIEFTGGLDGLNITDLELFLRLPGLMKEFNISSLSEIQDKFSDEEKKDFFARFLEGDAYAKDS